MKQKDMRNIGKINDSFQLQLMKSLIGFLIFSGYHNLCSERDFWSEKDLMVLTEKNAMSRNKYLEIKSVIHFANNYAAMKKKSDHTFKIGKL
ncbi:hypothetical protein X975_21500, partial [Stegodyphus mimosarum]